MTFLVALRDSFQTRKEAAVLIFAAGGQAVLRSIVERVTTDKTFVIAILSRMAFASISVQGGHDGKDIAEIKGEQAIVAAVCFRHGPVWSRTRLSVANGIGLSRLADFYCPAVPRLLCRGGHEGYLGLSLIRPAKIARRISLSIYATCMPAHSGHS